MPEAIFKNRENGAASEPWNGLVTNHLGLVREIAKSIGFTEAVPGDHEDLVGAGMLALLDAARKFDPAKGVPFRSYARHRIRGSIRDGQRALDLLPRALRQQQPRAQQAIAQLTGRLGRPPTEEEIARHLGLSLTHWQKLAQQFYEASAPVMHAWPDGQPPVPVEQLESTAADPEQTAARMELRRILKEAIRSLPPRYQKMIALYYWREWTMQAIAEELGVNESRVSQIHSRAMTKLRHNLIERGWGLATLIR
jgi:RNA polymerase sigma factor for flagellar operon FliA